MVGLTALMSVGIGYMADILKGKERALREQYEAASRDTLTGLYNYGYFEKRLREEFASAREQKMPLTLLFWMWTGLRTITTPTATLQPTWHCKK